MSMKKFDRNKILRGSFGKVWLDDERMFNVKSYEAKVTLNYEEVDVNGDLGKHQRYLGYSIAGTMVLHKYDTTVGKKYADGIASGDLPDLSMVGALDDPTAYGAERVQLTEVTLDEVTLLKFENGTVTEEEVPFKAAAFKYLDTI